MNAIASTLVIKSQYKIVISIYTTFDMTEVVKLLDDIGISYELILRVDRLDQFEHIRLLTEGQRLNDDDWVIFLDDDDMFVLDPSKYLLDDVSGFVGYQFIPESSEGVISESYDLNIRGLHDFVKKYYKSMLWEDDFSGTSIRYKYLKSYFNQDYKPVFPRSLEDTKFMDFVERETVNPLKLKDMADATPFIFHRLKDVPSLWTTNLIDDVRRRLLNISVE
jgi:hypothetical protein